MRKSLIFWMPLEIDFWWNFGGFCEENGSKMAPKSEPKSILALKRKNQLNASRLVPNWVRRVQVGSKNRSKIVQNLKSKLECLLAATFHRFLWVLGGKLGRKTEPRSIKNRSKKASKKWWKKEGVLEGSGWGNSRAGVGGGRNPGPPKAPKSKKITKHKSH